MAERPQWVPDGLDLDRPSVARTHDHHPGGSRNPAVHRALADRSGPQVVLRTGAGIAAPFDGIERVEPGPVNAALRETPDRGSGYGGVGRES